MTLGDVSFHRVRLTTLRTPARGEARLPLDHRCARHWSSAEDVLGGSVQHVQTLNPLAEEDPLVGLPL